MFDMPPAHQGSDPIVSPYIYVMWVGIFAFILIAHLAGS